jgi:ADP-heptose:LPS heptosyltransferase
MAKACPWIDQIIIDEQHDSVLVSAIQLAKILGQRKFDAVITLFSQFKTGLAVWLAGIPYRLAPATKLYQTFYNQRLKQRRSRSAKPEYEYNLDLVRYYLNSLGVPEKEEPAPPYLQFDVEEITRLKTRFMHEHHLPAEHKLVFIHPGSGGSAKNLSLSQYAELASRLQSRDGHVIVITAGSGEEQIARMLSALLKTTPHVVYESKEGLRSFAEHIQLADLFISGSTGPLHIAGALDRPTAAFYPRRRSSTALRWQTLNRAHNRFAFTPPESADENDMSSIDVSAAAEKISQLFLMP